MDSILSILELIETRKASFMVINGEDSSKVWHVHDARSDLIRNIFQAVASNITNILIVLRPKVEESHDLAKEVELCNNTFKQYPDDVIFTNYTPIDLLASHVLYRLEVGDRSASIITNTQITDLIYDICAINDYLHQDDNVACVWVCYKNKRDNLLCRIYQRIRIAREKTYC